MILLKSTISFYLYGFLWVFCFEMGIYSMSNCRHHYHDKQQKALLNYFILAMKIQTLIGGRNLKSRNVVKIYKFSLNYTLWCIVFYF